MSQQKQNLRIRRTQKLLREALIELIEERGFEALTVVELTERAMISRAAFYRNYQDKYDLVEQIFEEAMNALQKAVSETDTDHPSQIWIQFFEHIEEHERLYGALLGENGSPWFISKMRQIMIDLIKKYQEIPVWQSIPDRPIYPDSDKFVPHIVATLFVESITWWLENRKPYSPEEMLSRCALLVSAIFKETSTWE